MGSPCRARRSRSRSGDRTPPGRRSSAPRRSRSTRSRARTSTRCGGTTSRRPEEQPADLVRPVRLQPLAAQLAARAHAEPELLGQEGLPGPDRLPRGLGHEHAVQAIGQASSPCFARSRSAANRGRAAELEPSRPVRAGVLVGAHRHAAGRRATGSPAGFVRQALIRGINRSAITGALYRTISPNARAPERDLQAIRVAVQAELEEVHVQPRGGRAAAPHEPLHRGSDGIYSCPGVGKLSASRRPPAASSASSLRGDQSQLKAVGIEVKSTFGPASHVFGTVLPSRDWDLFMFGWQGSPVSALTDVAIHGCGGDQNDMGTATAR